MVINSKIAYVKKKEVFEPLINTIPSGLNPIVFIEDTREMWTCGTYFSIGYPSIEISETSGSVKVQIGNSFFLMSTTGDSISVRKGDGNRIIISSNALSKVDTEPPLEWDTSSRKLLHMESGVAPGSYGQSTSLGNASVFIVPNIVVDSTGHITYAQNYNVEIRDYVEQLAPSTLMGNRNVLLSYNEANENMDTSQVRKANGLYFNDATQKLTVTGGIDSGGPVNVNHGDLTVVDGYIIGNLKGDVEGEAKPKIHLSDKPEYGGASINLYGHVKLQDVLNNQPEPSSDNDNINNVNVVNAIAASPLMVWNAIQTAKDYADSILSANNSMVFKGSIEAGTKSPGTFTPYGQVGNTYVVTFGTGSYTDSIGYVNGEPVEIGDLLICREETPAATSATWEEIKPKWVYVQTNTTGVVSGPSSSLVGQLAIFNSTSGKLIKGLPNGNVGQMLVIGNSGIPEWANKPDRLNYALSFQVRGTEFVSFDGYAEKKVNFIAGDNMFITSDAQGNLTLAADPGSDTVNTAGATNNINTKLFLIGAESQTTSPQTYSNQYVYIGPDNKLYSNGKEVSTTDHNHDDRYVNVTGDTMTGLLTIGTSTFGTQLKILRTNGTDAAMIQFANNASTLGFIGIGGTGNGDDLNEQPVFYTKDMSANKILHTGNYASTLDTRYVKKSGDTMTGTLILSSNKEIRFGNSSYDDGRIIAVDGTLYIQGATDGIVSISGKNVDDLSQFTIFAKSAFIGTNKIWHAGNDGSGSGLDADLLDGIDSSYFYRDKNATIGASDDWNTFNYNGAWRATGNFNGENAPSSTYKYGLLSVFKSKSTVVQIYFPDWTTYNIQCRTCFDVETGGFRDWKSIAFTDSNVASATKLQTPRTIWGQSFDGTGNVSGVLSGWIGNATNWTDTWSDGTNSHPWYGYDHRYVNTGVYSSTISDYSGLCLRTDNGYLVMTEAGNVGIGTPSPSYKCHVAGTFYASGAATLGNILTVSSYVYSESGWFQNNTENRGLYNSALDARWYATSNGWYSDKAATFTGAVTSTGFKKSGSSDSYILLGGGGHKNLSEIFKYLGQNVSSDWDTITTMGTMRVTQQTIVNGPSNAYTYGQLLTFNAGGTLSQIYLPHSSSGSMYIRTGWSGVSQYYDWIQVLTTANYSSILDSRYVNVAGDTMTGVLTVNNSNQYSLVINSSYSFETAIHLLRNGTSKGVIGYHDTQGTYLYNRASGKFISNRDDGNAYFDNNKIWHAGNDGSGSGLDADLLDGYSSTSFMRFYRQSGVDANSLVTGYPVIVEINQGSNLPTTNDWHQLMNWGSDDGNYGFQLTNTYTTNNSLYFRHKIASKWYDWITIIDTNNYTAYIKKIGTTTVGSATRPIYLNAGVPTAGTYTFGNANGNAAINNGTVCTNLNADLLDGKHAFDFYNYGYVMFENTIDASALDVNTYYPVTFGLDSSSNVRIECRVSLDSGTKPSWSTHYCGFSVRKIWETNGNGWGTNPINRRILVSDYAFTSTDPVRGIGQLTNSSVEYVYVRGGGKYYFYISHNISAVLRTSTYTTINQSVSPTTSAPAAITRNIMMSGDAISNADTVDGYHASGLFTGFSNSGNNLSITIGGTTKTLTPAYATSSGNADKLDGYHVSSSQNPFGKIPLIAENGVMEVGRYLDFHYSSSDTRDYGVRLQITNSTGSCSVNLPTSSGTLALTTDKVAYASSADKLGTSTIGSGTKPIYLSSGTPTASSSSVGDSYSPVYLANGTLTKCSGYTVIAWGRYRIVCPDSGSAYIAASIHSHSFISSVKKTATGKVTVNVSYPSRCNADNTFVFGNGVSGTNGSGPLYVSINGTSSTLDIRLADDSSFNNGVFFLNFIAIDK